MLHIVILLRASSINVSENYNLQFAFYIISLTFYVIKFVSGLRQVSGFSGSSNNKTDCHDITEILLKVKNHKPIYHIVLILIQNLITVPSGLLFLIINFLFLVIGKIAVFRFVNYFSTIFIVNTFAYLYIYP
jgi:hypothetical protein